MLAEGGEDAKPLAGGHSLIPLMKLGWPRPRCSSTCARFPGSTGSSARTGAGGSAR